MNICYWCKKDCNGTCLPLLGSVQMKPGDPAYYLLTDNSTSTPVVYNSDCYICNDPEFAQMGLPLCRKCPNCKDGGHIPADDSVCTYCKFDEQEAWENYQSDLGGI